MTPAVEQTTEEIHIQIKSSHFTSVLYVTYTLLYLKCHLKFYSLLDTRKRHILKRQLIRKQQHNNSAQFIFKYAYTHSHKAIFI